jgi:hypothetical protein
MYSSLHAFAQAPRGGLVEATQAIKIKNNPGREKRKEPHHRDRRFDIS